MACPAIIIAGANRPRCSSRHAQPNRLPSNAWGKRSRATSVTQPLPSRKQTTGSTIKATAAMIASRHHGISQCTGSPGFGCEVKKYTPINRSPIPITTPALEYQRTVFWRMEANRVCAMGSPAIPWLSNCVKRVRSWAAICRITREKPNSKTTWIATRLAKV